jgi:protein-S-isoprenylcysteine O-methyltransferase Ste14
MNADASCTPGVIAPPPLIALAAIVAGLALDRLYPVALVASLPASARYTLAAVLIGLAGFVSFAAIRCFRRAGTHVEPWKPSTALVTEGIFTRTRNPMYIGLGLLLAGLGLALSSDWTLLFLIAFALIIHFGVVRREERYLERKFGDAYRRYRARVPRYFWRF